MGQRADGEEVDPGACVLGSRFERQSARGLQQRGRCPGVATLHGDLGLSFTFFPAPVSQVIGQALPWTVLLVGITTIVSFFLGTGLGVLAGDHLKTASDLGLPMVGVGLFYRESYFRQQIDREGQQG